MSTLMGERVNERAGFKIRWRYVIAFVILLPVIAHFFYAVTRSPLMNYYLTVDELMTQGKSDGRARVGADVVMGSVDWDNRTRTLHFELQGEGRTLPVTYRGFAPDTFRESATVIVEGELNRDGTFTAYSVLVKCPHKYVPI